LIALDSSVVVASFGAWHEQHELARSTLVDDPRLTAHTALEVYSLLTRLPEPFRADPGTVVEFLRRTFPAQRLVLARAQQQRLPSRLADLGVAGGAVYDALIALTTLGAEADLLTLDQRALTTYERCGASARLLR